MDIRVLIGNARKGFFPPSLTVDGWLRLIDSDAQLGTGIPRPDPSVGPSSPFTLMCVAMNFLCVAIVI